MKLSAQPLYNIEQGRAPHGARGLKLTEQDEELDNRKSRPARGAWIETFLSSSEIANVPVAPRMGYVD